MKIKFIQNIEESSLKSSTKKQISLEKIKAPEVFLLLLFWHLDLQVS
jgi:hypothetical protein